MLEIIANALVQIAEKIIRGESIEYGIYHFSGEPYVSWCDFAKVILAEAVSQNVLEKVPFCKRDYHCGLSKPG